MKLYFLNLSINERTYPIKREFSLWTEEYDVVEKDKYFEIVFESDDEMYDFDKPLPRGNNVYKPETYTEESLIDDLMSGYSFENHISYFGELNIGVYTRDIEKAKPLLFAKMKELLDKRKKALEDNYTSLENLIKLSN